MTPTNWPPALRRNATEANVHIVIACDKAPGGVYEQAKSVSAQSHLGFSLDVVEVTPSCPRMGRGDAIMFVPNVRLSTEIVARTAVSITYEAGSPQPGVTIETTSVEEIEENLATAAAGRRPAEPRPHWTDEEIEEAMLASDDPVVHDLFLFAKRRATAGEHPVGQRHGVGDLRLLHARAEDERQRRSEISSSTTSTVPRSGRLHEVATGDCAGGHPGGVQE